MIQGYINFSPSFLNIQRGERGKRLSRQSFIVLRSHLEYTMIGKGKNKMLKKIGKRNSVQGPQIFKDLEYF